MFDACWFSTKPANGQINISSAISLSNWVIGELLCILSLQVSPIGNCHV